MSFRSSAMSPPDPSSTTKRFFEAMKSEKASSLADVFLITSDGQRIPAVRALLRFSSPYFEKLLSSEFAEKNLSEVPVSISASLLHELLEFVYTDDCSLLRRVRERDNKATDLECQVVVAVFELADVGDYVALERLVTRCKETMRDMLLMSSHFLCLAWQYLHNKGSATWEGDIITEAMALSMGDIEELFLLREAKCSLKCGLLHLDEHAVEDAFVSCDNTEAGEEMKFQALIVWATGGTALRDKPRTVPWTNVDVYVDTEKIMILEERREVAKRIATWIDVHNIKPRFLAHVIEPSGLVERDVLYEAYRLQATELEENMASTESRSLSNDRTLKKLRREVKELREKF